jgi:hypothetical protein
LQNHIYPVDLEVDPFIVLLSRIFEDLICHSDSRPSPILSRIFSYSSNGMYSPYNDCDTIFFGFNILSFNGGIIRPRDYLCPKSDDEDLSKWLNLLFEGHIGGFNLR